MCDMVYNTSGERQIVKEKRTGQRDVDSLASQFLSFHVLRAPLD